MKLREHADILLPTSVNFQFFAPTFPFYFADNKNDFSRIFLYILAVESSDRNIHIVIPDSGNISHTHILNYSNMPKMHFKFKWSTFVYCQNSNLSVFLELTF